MDAFEVTHCGEILETKESTRKTNGWRLMHFFKRKIGTDGPYFFNHEHDKEPLPNPPEFYGHFYVLPAPHPIKENEQVQLRAEGRDDGSLWLTIDAMPPKGDDLDHDAIRLVQSIKDCKRACECRTSSTEQPDEVPA